MGPGQLQFKQAVKEACLSRLDQRISTARTAMDQAQENANLEEKSSAGDKYETARAMSQHERDMNARQLDQVLRDRKQLDILDVSTEHTIVGPGSLFRLEGQLYFAGAGLGQINVNNTTIIAISLQSPLYQQIRGRGTGEELTLAGKLQTIRSIV